MSPQYKVPQNVDMQDKIVGPLTMFQFLYLLGGGMVFYTTLKTPSPIDLIFIGIPVGLLALCFAFVKINDQPFIRFIFSFFYFITHPKARLWHHAGMPTNSKPMITQDQVTNKRVTRKLLDLQRVKDVAGRLDKGK